MTTHDMVISVVEYLARSLVDAPDQVRVTEKESEDSGMCELELSVAEEDMGKVIGKQGRIAKALRAVVKAASMRSAVKYTVEIV